MPLEQQHAPMDDDEEVRRMGRGGASSSSRSSVAKSIPKPRPQEWDAGDAGPTSPRVRKRLDDAKENANLFGPVCEQGEVIQWMTACHSDLNGFGHELERRGFQTLSSIAFLTEEDLDGYVEDKALQQHLLATLARLRHEFFRM